MVITIVGDKALVKPGLKRLGYEVVELDKEGNLLTTASSTTVPCGSRVIIG